MPLPRPGADRRPHRVDALIAAAGLAVGSLLWTLGLFTQPAAGADYGTWALLTLGAVCLAALLRRVAQPWALLLGTCAVVADLFTGGLLATFVLFSDLVYAAVLYGTPRVARLLPPWSVAASAAFTVGLAALVRQADALLVGLVFGAVTAGSAYTGLLVRTHRETAAAERLRAEQTALLAEMDRTQAVNAERARMARELHDLVANHLSAIALHATAAQSLGDATATAQALGVIRENSVQGLAEMRRLIGILRQTAEDSGEPAARPTLSGLPALVAHADAGGGPGGLRCVLRGEHAPTGPLPAPVELAAYRVVQEALTNALKHAAPGEVTVDLRRTGEVLDVTVRSALGGGREGPRVPGSGAGLIGMRERVELLGGTFAAGPDADRWRVAARLPLTEREEVRAP
ncbi:histidine kinase [Streptomyces sp. TRM70308]|uniref:sensor histidine kinase n=1 Tax=Streptomyces sp. TRM70308 TaxID=3131932 RepID=UPI003D02B276